MSLLHNVGDKDKFNSKMSISDDDEEDKSKMIIQKLKGGSLSSTYLIEIDSNRFVRKEVSLIKDRVYGFQRWYSQLKRIQRYSVQFIDLFPAIYEYGKIDNTAYFDMQYFENSITAHEFLIKCVDEEKINRFFTNLVSIMKNMYSVDIKSSQKIVDLYIYEEVEQKLKDAECDEFNNFLKNEYIIFNGEEVKSFIYCLDEFKNLFRDNYTNPTETYTHGNLTLENILYDVDNDKIYYIDAYEENIIDSKLADYSQILQSCNSKYEVFNDLVPRIIGNEVTIDIINYYGLNYFNDLFNNYIKDENLIVIKLLEISQFLRMLPFKKEISKDHMIFFYSLASKLFNDVKKQFDICGM